MAEREIGAVLVMTEDRPGRRHLHRARPARPRGARPGATREATPISLVMTRDVRFVTPGTTTEAALALMHLHRSATCW